MNASAHIYSSILAAALLLTGAPAFGASSNSFSRMSVDEVSELLDSREITESASAKVAESSPRFQILPVPVSACDLVSKVYGVLDPDLSRQECMNRSRQVLRLTPQDDNGALWLDSSDGFAVCYAGMSPDVSALARFGEGSSPDARLSDFGWFFIFPYSPADKGTCVRSQADFCGSLLQEMADNGLPLGLNSATPDLFEAAGEYLGSFVDVRLLDDSREDGNGRFILILSVEPNAFSTADNLAAEL